MAATTDGNKLSGEDRQKLFAYHFRKELAAETVRRAAIADKSANRKLAKGADPSFTGQKFDHYLKAHFGEDDQKPVDRLKSDRENLAWLGLIPSTDGGDLFKQGDRVDREAMVRAKGYKAGLLGLDRVSGFDGGSVDDKLFLESYDAGKTEYETELPEIMKKVSAATTHEEPPATKGFDPFSTVQSTGKPN